MSIGLVSYGLKERTHRSVKTLSEAGKTVRMKCEIIKIGCEKEERGIILNTSALLFIKTYHCKQI